MSEKLPRITAGEAIKALEKAGFFLARQSGAHKIYKNLEGRRGTAMEFWEGEHCEYCNGLIVEKKVSLSRKIKGKYVLIENVPAGVCTGCGTRYYAANILKTIEETIRGRRKAEREIRVPVYSL